MAKSNILASFVYVVQTVLIRTSADSAAFQAPCSDLFCSQNINSFLRVHSQRRREDPGPKASIALRRSRRHFVACFGETTAKNLRRPEGKEISKRRLASVPADFEAHEHSSQAFLFTLIKLHN